MTLSVSLHCGATRHTLSMLPVMTWPSCPFCQATTTSAQVARRAHLTKSPHQIRQRTGFLCNWHFALRWNCFLWDSHFALGCCQSCCGTLIVIDYLGNSTLILTDDVHLNMTNWGQLEDGQGHWVMGGPAQPTWVGQATDTGCRFKKAASTSVATVTRTLEDKLPVSAECRV